MADMLVVALLPAHDEERTLPAALASLRAQTRPPDRIVVVAATTLLAAGFALVRLLPRRER